MSTFTDEIRPRFSIDLLKALDTSRAYNMAQMLIDTYIVNASALSLGHEMLNALQFDDAEKEREAKMMDNLARHNLAAVGDRLGARLIRCEETDTIREPIKNQEMISAAEVTGVPDLRLWDSLRTLAPDGKTNTLRLFRKPPSHPSSKRTAWWDVEMIGPDLEPLVDIQILPPRRSVDWLRYMAIFG